MSTVSLGMMNILNRFRKSSLMSHSHIEVHHDLISFMFMHSVNFMYRCRSFLTTMLMRFGKCNAVTATLKTLADWLLGILYGRRNSFTAIIQLKTTLILPYCAY